MHLSFDIIFIQELSWTFIQSIPSFISYEGEELVGVPNYPNWTIFSRNSFQAYNSLKVITYINICIFSLHFSLWNDILSHRDISCISFFNCGSIYYLINIYSDLSQSALKYLKDTKININNVFIMTGDFNIRDIFWDLNFLYYSTYKDTFLDIADSFQLELSKFTEFFLY